MRIAMSYYCNLHCEHCYVPEEDRVFYGRRIQPNQLTIEELEAFIDVLSAEFSTKSISITGGEALLRVVWPRTERVMQCALEHGLAVRLITAGSGQIDIDTVLRSARRSDRLQLQVSLDGTDSDLTDRFRGRIGAWQRAVETIRTIADAGASVLVRYTITEANIDQTEACYDLVTSLGAAAFVVKPMFPTGTARQHTDLLLTPASVQQLQQRLVMQSVKCRTKLKLPQPCYLHGEDIPHGANVEIMYCGCGRDVAYLTPSGDIYPCTYMVGMAGMERWKLGNLRDPLFDLRAMWSSPDTYQAFRDAPNSCHCTAQNIAYEAEEAVACAH
jgi:radical SAM protein with 4Fe4S-binding SPASM domain